MLMLQGVAKWFILILTHSPELVLFLPKTLTTNFYQIFSSPSTNSHSPCGPQNFLNFGNQNFLSLFHSYSTTELSQLQIFSPIISVMVLLQFFFFFSLPFVTSCVSSLSYYFLIILAMALPKFTSFLLLLNKFETYLYHK